ncbi:IS3 family transposase [Pontibacter qinzhouensis]|uniref:IS3 family transposase n=1 Tax=Pontibacter qinzhouensis TaxID=2603253 RepID=A0A5C8J4T9_9BACT|nr:IS3 family transposase [Pontibacter qinzhouensis]TXK29870.1 IS3 family transposase [Pontibacter qinzhouensis]
MQLNYPHVHIRELERLLGFTRQGYYQYWQRQGKQVNYEEQVIELVKQVRQDHPRIGGRKLYQLLQPELDKRGVKVGRDAFFNLLSERGMLIRRRRRKAVTTFSRHRFRKYPNLIRELLVERVNQVWVSDITYWFTPYACLYISLVTDSYSRRIMGYAVAETLAAVHSKEALLMALEHIDTRSGKHLIHHSDRGIQYCSKEYVEVLESYSVQISMTENGDPLENPIAERVNGILKQEYLHHQQVYFLAQGQAVLEQAVFLYNYKRPHLSCDMLSPEQAHRQTGQLRRRWKNYFKKKVLSTYADNEKQDEPVVVNLSKD